MDTDSDLDLLEYLHNCSNYEDAIQSEDLPDPLYNGIEDESFTASHTAVESVEDSEVCSQSI